MRSETIVRRYFGLRRSGSRSTSGILRTSYYLQASKRREPDARDPGEAEGTEAEARRARDAAGSGRGGSDDTAACEPRAEGIEEGVGARTEVNEEASGMRGRGDLVDWYRRNREAVARAVRSDRSRGVLHPADCPAQSDRVLRRPPAGVQPDLSRQARVSADRASRTPSGSNSCSPAASIRTPKRPPCRAAAPRPCGPRATRSSRSASAPTQLVVDALLHGAFDLEGRVHPAMQRWRSDLHGARARGDAPGDAPVHVASPAARPRSRSPSM